MAQVVLTFEGGTEGADLTAANTGAASITLVSPGTARFRATAKQSGSFGGEFVAGSAGYSFARVNAVASSGSAALAMEFVCPTLPTTTDKTIMNFRSTTTSLSIPAAITPLGKIRVQAGGVTVVNPFPTATTGDNVLIPGQSYLLEVLASGQSATAGRVEARLTRKSSGAVLGTVLSTTANVTTDLIGSADFGVLPTTDQAYTMLVDNCRIIDNNTVGAWPGLYTGTGGTAPLTASVTVSPTSGTVPFTVTATASSAGGSGTTKTYAFNWGDGSSTAAQSSATATHQYTSAGTYTVTVTVTGS